MGNVSVSKLGEDAANQLYMLQVVCELWIKVSGRTGRHQAHWSPRPFVLGFTTDEDANVWLGCLHRTILDHKSQVNVSIMLLGSV